MLLFGLILIFFIGYAAICSVALEATLPEKVGFSFPIGVGAITLLMLLLDALGIPLTGQSELTAGIVSLVLLIALVAFRLRGKSPLSILSSQFSIFNSLKHINVIWLILLGALAWVEYANFSKCLYFPTYDRDSMAGFDTIGFLIAQEHTLRGLSIFQGDYMQAIHAAGSYISYTPMVQLSYAFVYSLGAETSKCIPALMFLSLIVGFYGLTARYAGRTAAMLATLFMTVTPEMISFSSLSGTNVMQAAAAAPGLVYVASWFSRGERSDLRFGSLLLAVSIWCRAEGFVFILVAGLLVLIRAIRQRDYWALLCPALSLLPAICWSVFTKSFNMYAEGVIIAHPLFDGAKADTIWGYAKGLITNTQYYGWTFSLCLLAFLADIYFMVKRRDSLAIFGGLVLSIALYLLVLYHIDYKWDTLDNVMKYSAKRFFFCFVPIAWYFIFTCHPVRLAFTWLDRQLAWEKE